jgi:hypothetical protein
VSIYGLTWVSVLTSEGLSMGGKKGIRWIQGVIYFLTHSRLVPQLRDA